MVDIILDDPGLSHKISASEIQEGAQAAADLNTMIVNIIKSEGLANDGKITASDVYRINAVIQGDDALHDRFLELHGNDENGVETGFHLVQGDGANTRIFSTNAVNTLADGIYHIGFDIEKGRFLNEDGDRNASVTTVASWIDGLLHGDYKSASLMTAEADPIPDPATGTGLDDLIDMIEADPSLERRIDVADIGDGVEAANTMNALLLEGLKATGAANDGVIQTSDMRDVNTWLRADADRYQTFLEAHGNDENGVETGFHLVQGDGAVSRLYGENGVNTVADGIYHFGFDIDRGRFLNEDGDKNQSVEKVAAWVNELLTDDDKAALVNADVVTSVTGSTGTGLDRLVEIITSDVGLDRRISDEEIAAGAEAANVMNGLIIEAIQATGVANDGTLSAGDIRDMSTWVMMNRKEAFLEAHGDDEGNIETGFHLVQNDGAKTRIFGDNAVDTVADGLYHLPFGYRKDRIINEDGNNNQTLEDLAWWSEALRADELAEAAQGQGVLFNADENPRAVALTGTGLDQIIDIIFTDIGINKNVATSDAQEAAEAATGISTMILDAIREQGLVDDGDLTASDVYAINSYIRENPDLLEQFITFHGNDENGVETGYHLVQNNGGQTFLFSKNALDTVADGLFHIGFDIVKGRFQNEDGDNNASVETVAYWLEQMLSDDIDSGALDSELEAVAGTTGTGLDSLVDIVMTDPGLQKRISELDIREGAEAADAINAMIVEAIEMTGVAANGEIKRSDVFEINDYIRANHYDAFVEAHGNDENGVETGFHLVQGDGANTVLFSNNAVNTVADGLYHIGFEIDECGRLTNEDGNANVSITTAAGWLDSLLTAADYQRLSDAAVVNPYIMGTTGTGLDQLVNIVTSDDGLINRISTSDIRDGAEAAQGMNELILDAIRDTGVANDGSISAYDVLAINDVIRGDASALATFTELHGNDEQGVETGFHLVQGDGARTELFERNAVNTVADGIYHIGFEVKNNRFVNEDGDANASVSTVAGWLDDLLADDLADGSLVNSDLLPEAVDLAALQQAEVRSMEAPFEVTKEGGAVELADGSDLDLAAATVIVGFTADNAQDAGKDVFFSRDGAYYQDGGHLSMWVEKGDLVARFQTAEDQVYLKANDVIEDGTAYDVAFTFNGSEAQLYLDGAIVDIEASTATWENADEAILLGGSLMQRRDGQDRVDDRFEGTIDDFFIFNRELNFAEIQAATQQDYGVLV